jgi:hypothetical protein
MKAELVNVETGAIVEQSQSAQMIDMIGRLASDPNADIDKMERLMAMRERMQEREAEMAFNDALSIMMPEIPAIKERGEIEFKGKVQSTYALWEDVNEIIKPILAKHGFSLNFKTETKPEIKVTGVLRHRQGYKDTAEFIATADTSGSKNSIQGIKSTISYGKRTIADALLNITSHGEDDDAFSAGESYDTTPWTEKIMNAKSREDLDKISADIKADPNVPKSAIVLIRKAWAGQAKQLEKTNENG